MTLSRCWFFVKTWVCNLISFKTLSIVLSSLGSLWAFVKMLTCFFEKTTLPDKLQTYWYIFVGIGIILAAIQRRPRLSVAHKLNGRDVTIEIAIGDLLSFSGALVVGTNTTFDTSITNGLISKRSIQGKYTQKYYKNTEQIDKDISSSLIGIQSEPLPGSRLGKSDRYPMGTVVRLYSKNQTAYFLAIANLNEHGVASGTFDELKDSLAKLWVFIGSRGSKETLIMPVLGTGFARLPQTREEIIREIVRSFVAACSERIFADKLMIVVSPHDVTKCKLSLDELGAFVRYVCEYTDFALNGQQAIGTPV